MHGPASLGQLYAAATGYGIEVEIGVSAIRAKSVRQVALLFDEARALGLTPHSPEDPERRGGMAILDVPHGEAVTRELLRREILVDHRPGAGIRLSPHFYTTDDEVRLAVRSIREILDSRSYEAHLQAGGTGF